MRWRATKSGGVATIKSSFGVSSVVRNSAGDYTITWSTPFSSATSYVIEVIASDPNVTFGSLFLTGANPVQAASVTMQTRDILNPTVSADMTIVMLCAFGT